MRPTPRQRIKILKDIIARVRKNMEHIENDGGVLPPNDPLIMTWTRARRELRKLQGVV